MSRVQIEPLTPERLNAFCELSRRAWERPVGEAFFRWRYLDSPNQRTLIALREGECVATLSAFARPYRWGGRDVICLETHDWYCVPEFRPLGLGMRVMREMMNQRDPLVCVAGTSDTRALLPRLRWTHLDDIGRYVLPLGGQPIVQAAHLPPGRSAAAVGRIARSATSAAFRLRPMRRPAGMDVVPVAALGEEILALYDDDSTSIVPVPQLAFLRWLMTGFPGMGHFVPLYLTDHGRLRGWSLGRVYSTPSGCEAQISDVYVQDADPALLGWVVRQLVLRLMAFHPDAVRAIAGTPHLRRALMANGFRLHSSEPVHVWPAGILEDTPGRPQWTLNNGDLAIMPYPCSWPPQVTRL